MDAAARYTVVEASTKTGKTVACLVWLFERAIAGKEDCNYWWVAPTYGVARIAYRRLKQWLNKGGFAGHFVARESDRAIELPGGRLIWFKGGDKPDTLYGEDVYGAVIDEATRCRQDAWYAVRSTLTATRAPVKIIGNVRGRKNWAYRLARKAEGGAANFAYFKLTAWDAVEAGVLAREEVEDARENLPEDAFRELYLAEPSDDGGNPFGLAAIAACEAPLSTAPPVCFGVDLAKKRDWTVVIGLDDAGRVCVLERWRSDWGQTRRRVLQTIGDRPALIDSTGVGDPIVEDLQRASSRVEGFLFGQRSKQQIIEGLCADVQQGRVRFPRGVLTAEMENFEYQYTRTGVLYSAPVGFHDDTVYALALADHLRRRYGRRVLNFVGVCAVVIPN